MRFLVAAFCFVALSGCARKAAVPDLGGIYDKAAMNLSADLSRNPVIVIPGVLGSRLEGPDGEIVWGEFGSGGVDPRTPEGRALLAVPADGSDDGVRATAVIERFRANLFGITFEQSAYENLLKTLGAGGYIDQDMSLAGDGEVNYGEDHFTCHQFPYDWRRELSTSAIKLHAFLLEKRDEIRKQRVAKFGLAAVKAAEAEHGPMKFDVVAHSMGGLVLRYYLMYGPTPLDELGDAPTPTWAGAELVEDAILVGTPNGGSYEAVRILAEGKRFSPLLPSYDAELLQTMPALWQLLPVESVYPARVDGAAANNWAYAMVYGAGLEFAEGFDMDHRFRMAEVATKFHKSIGVDSRPPDGLRLMLFVADAKPTTDGMLADFPGGPWEVTATAPGDGTVTRRSALMDRDPGPRLDTPIPWHRVQFLHTDHLGMTRDPGFTDNVLFLLLVDEPIRDVR
ncbi:MAG: hypothetical protein AAF656_03815 [Planctomycetota bacterium]